MNYREIKEKMSKEERILKDLEKSNINGTPYKNTEEEVLDAQQEFAKRTLNEFYYKRYLPFYSSILYLFFYLFSIIIFVLQLIEVQIKVFVIIGIVLMLLIIALYYLLNRKTDKIYDNISSMITHINNLSKFASDTFILS